MSVERKWMLLAVVLLAAPQGARSQNTANLVCAPGQNCTNGAALVCTAPVLNSIFESYVTNPSVSICRCANETFAGPNCDTACPGGHSRPCNLNGECKYEDATCVCDTGWVGDQCDQPCPVARSQVCGGKGTCVSDGTKATCSCNFGWRGDICELECAGTAARPCRGRGTCEVDATCTCQGGWRGADCSQECPGSSLFPCNLNGKCTLEATCECDPLYRGFSCEFKCPSVRDIPCGGRGVCNASGTCNCNKGFRGVDCMRECAGGVQNPCSGHGECLEDASCRCSDGWSGPGCTEVCPGGLGNPCSGHGACLSTATGSSCRCEEGNGTGVLLRYAGDDCSIPVYNPVLKATEYSNLNESDFRPLIIQRTNVAFSTVSPLLVFIAMMAVIFSRLFTQITEARQAEIDAINQQIDKLSKPLEE